MMRCLVHDLEIGFWYPLTAPSEMMMSPLTPFTAQSSESRSRVVLGTFSLKYGTIDTRVVTMPWGGTEVQLAFLKLYLILNFPIEILILSF